MIRALETCAKMNGKNNPGHVKKPDGDEWRGTDAYDAKGHVIFTRPWWGWRALFRTLQSKYLNGKHTIREIMHDYAPVTDGNEPDEYADTVAEWCGTGPDVDLNLCGSRTFTDGPQGVWAGLTTYTTASRTIMLRLACAISLYENGHEASPADMDGVLEGYMIFEHDFIGK